MKAKQFLVLGLGRFGMSVARTLCELGQEVLAVDADEKLVEDAAPYVTQAIQLDATDEEALSSLDVQNFDVAIVSIGQNTRDSILISVLLKELGVPCLVAKANDDLHAKVLRKIGVDRVVFPERDMALRLASRLETEKVLDFVQLSEKINVTKMIIPAKAVGKSVLDINLRKRFGINIIAIENDGNVVDLVTPDYVFKDNDILFLSGSKESIDKLTDWTDR